MEDISKWVEAHTSELYSWAIFKTSDHEIAQDLVQDTFLAAAEKINNFKGDSSPKTWLFSILNHKIIDYYRKKVKQPTSLDSQSFMNFFEADGDWRENRKPREWQDDADEHLLDNSEFQQALKKCMGKLPDSWSMCMKLKYLEEKDGKEICEELGITPANFWQILHRAKLNLRECIENTWFEKR